MWRVDDQPFGVVMESRWQLHDRAAGGVDEPAREPGLEARLLHAWSLLRVVWAGRWFLVGGLIAGLVVVSIYSAYAPVKPVYPAEARLYVRQISGVTQKRTVSSNARHAAYAEAALLQSTTLLADTLGHADMAALAEVVAQPDRVGYLRKTLNVRVGRDDNIITLRANMSSPTSASRLVNAHVDTYLAYHDELNRSTNSDQLGLLNAERTHLEQAMAAQTAALVDLRERTGIAGLPGDALDLLTQSVRAISEEYAAVDRAAKSAADDVTTVRSLENDHAALVRFLRERTDMRTAGDPERQRKIDGLRQRRAALSARYGPRAPVIVAIDQRLADLDAASPADQPDTAAAIERISERRRVLEAQRTQLTRALADQQKQLAVLNERNAEIKAAQREIGRTRDLHEQVMSRIQLTGLTEAAPPLTIAVLDRATPATAPIGGGNKRRLLEGALLGFALGFALLIVHGLIRRRLGTASEVADAIGAPVVATLPKLEKSLSDRARGQYVLARGGSPYAESCRALRTAVLYAGRRSRGSAIAITSPVPGMGKSTVTANLAVCIAQTGRRVLVLDADLRRPRQHRFFDIKTDQSIADVLRETKQMQLRQLIHRTSVVGLDVLVCGSPADSPSEIMTSRIFADAFDQLRQGYDIVLIDCPPLLSVTDAQVGAALADQTIFVLNADTLARPVIQARRALEAVGAELFGAVVNAAPPTHGWLMRMGGFDRYGTSLYGYPSHKDAA